MSREHAHHHDHTHGMVKESLRTACFLTIVIFLAGLIGGFFSHSLALMTDAAHTLTDLVALGLAWFAAGQAERPADERKTFGYHRVGILVALFNAVLLIVIVIGIAWEAFQRFQHPASVQPAIMFVSAIIAIGMNLYIGFGLRKENANLNVRAATLHVFGDVGASVAVIVAGLIILATRWTLVDPLLSIVIAVYIAFGAFKIVRETTDILLESVPHDLSLTQIVADMKQVDGVVAIHDLHAWCITSEMCTLSCHVFIDEAPQDVSARILQELKALLHEKYHIHHATLQLECQSLTVGCCKNEGLYCQMDQPGHEHEHEHNMTVVSHQ